MIVRIARELWPTALGELLVLWMLVGLPALGYGDIHAALANHIALAMVLGPLIVIAGVLQAANATCALLGLWLAASPWVIGYAATASTGAINDLLTGLGLIALSALQQRRPHAHATWSWD